MYYTKLHDLIQNEHLYEKILQIKSMYDNWREFSIGLKMLKRKSLAGEGLRQIPATRLLLQIEQRNYGG